MYYLTPGDFVGGSWELVCYCFTVVAAFVSYFLALR